MGKAAIDPGFPPERSASFSRAAARLESVRTRDEDLSSPLMDAVGMDGAVVSALGGSLGDQTVGSSGRLAARIDEIQIDLGEGPSWEAARRRRPVLTADIQTSSGALWPSAQAAIRELGIGGLHAFPLFVGSIGIGALALYSMSPRALNAGEIAGVSGLAAIVSRLVLRSALENLETTQDGLAGGPYSRREMHQASGMISAQMEMSVDDALVLLRGHAFATGRTVQDVASDVVARRLDLSADGEA